MPRSGCVNRTRFNEAMIRALRAQGAQMVTFRVAQEIQDAALVRAAKHHVTGNYQRSIKVERRGKLDHVVVATDVNATQIEYGHYTNTAAKTRVETDNGRRKMQKGVTMPPGAHQAPGHAKQVEGPLREGEARRKWVDGLHIMRETARMFGGDSAVEAPRKGDGRLL